MTKTPLFKLLYKHKVRIFTQMNDTTRNTDLVKDSMAIQTCYGCMICELNAEHDCAYCDNHPCFCRGHFVQHLALAHWDIRDAEERACSLARESKYAEHHPCKWHEGDTPIIQDPDPENYLAPGCSNCGTMYPTKECEDTAFGKGCGLEYLDWGEKAFDDVIAGPYVTTSGDLYCFRCGPRMDEEEEQADDEDYYYPYEYDDPLP